MTTREYTTGDGEDMVQMDEDGTIRTYTSGTQDALYVGTDKTDAAASLEMSEEDFHNLTMSDPCIYDD